MDDLLARSQHHAEHGQFRQRRAEVLDVRRRVRGRRTAASPSSGRPACRRALRRDSRETPAACRSAARSCVVKKSTASGPRSGTRRPARRQSCCRLRAADRSAPGPGSRRCLGARQRRAGNPQPAAGARGGAAERGSFSTISTSRPRWRAVTAADMPAAAGADHEHVAFIRGICAIALAVQPRDLPGCREAIPLPGPSLHQHHPCVAHADSRVRTRYQWCRMGGKIDA